MPSKDFSPKAGPLPGPQFAPPPHPMVDVTRMPRPGDAQPEDRHVTTSVRKDKPFLMDDDFLWVTNIDSMPIEFGWAKKRWILAPGEAKAVIFQAVVNKLGDPRAVDGEQIRFDDGQGGRGIVLERYTELKRLFALYGVQMETLKDFTIAEGPRKGENIKGLTSLAPKCQITTLEGYPIQFPAYDPEMMAFPLVSTKANSVTSDVSRALDELQAENTDKERRISELEARIDRILQAQQGIED
jgi:hypothetical protein